jgi:hypothetical protein
VTAGYLELQTLGFGIPMALMGQPIVGTWQWRCSAQGHFRLLVVCFASGGVKELGFWEVNQTTLQDVHEVAPSQEEMQAAADARASAELAEAPRQVWCNLRPFAVLHQCWC